MKHKNLIALLLIFFSLLGGAAELHDWLIPTLSWPFTLSREFSFFQLPGDLAPFLAIHDTIHWFGWFCMAAILIAGLYLLLRDKRSLRFSPEIAKRFARFRKLKRGYYSMILLLGLIALASMDQCLVGKRALAVEYQGRWFFPAFTRHITPGAVFGLTGNAALAETDYRELAERTGQPDGPNWVILPPIPYDPTTDTVPFPTEQLPMREGVLYTADGKRPYNGQASRLYPNGQLHLRQRFRQGRPDGHAQGWAYDRRPIYAAFYKQGKCIRQDYRGNGSMEDFLALTSSDNWQLIHYHPSPPLVGGHLLGTNSQGADIAAYLFGGLQVNIKASLFYLPAIYTIGLTLGMMMGYFGGKFDMVTQRIIEILSQLPFLFVVMIISSLAPLELRGMAMVLGLLALFGWMGMTYMIRTSTMKEKTRDYVAAARIMGGGSFYIIRHHILPNMISIIVTLVPFSVAAVILSLASLDYMGFGLPENYASWGHLLNDGLSKLSSPWIVSSAFLALVTTLLLVTFIGEAAREAFDPRSNDHYE